MTTALFLGATGLGWAGVFGGGGGSADQTSGAEVARSAPYFDCPGGVKLGRFRAADRVLAVMQADGGWIGVRNPDDLLSTVWIDADDVSPDGGLTSLAGLPAGGCNTAEVVALGATTVPVTTSSTTVPTTIAPTTVPETVPSTTVASTVAPTVAPTTVPVNQPPAIGNLGAVPSSISAVVGSSSCGTSSSTITVNVSDATGVASVVVRWSVPRDGSGPATGTLVLGGPAGGGSWTGVLGALPNPPAAGSMVSLTVTARDPQGLESSRAFAQSLFLEYCLI